MEMYRGLSKKEWIESFEKRINTMKKDGKLKTIIPINKKIAQKAQELLREYCLEYNPPQRRDRMQALICDMFIAATAILYNFPIFTFNIGDYNWIRELNVLKPEYKPTGGKL